MQNENLTAPPSDEAHPPSSAAKKFGLTDGLFLLASALYALNRWVLKPRLPDAFLHDYLDDVLLMPCALPPLLVAQRWLKLRATAEPPTPGEITLYWAVWSVLFEVIGPHLFRRATGDPWDVAAYAAGGIFSGLWWHRHRLVRFRARP